MWNTVVTELLRLGLPGIVIAALAYAYWQKDLKLSESEKARTTDAQAVTTMLLDLHDKFRQTMEATRATIAAQNPVIERLEELMRDVKDAVRSRKS